MADPVVDFGAMQKHKARVVKTLTSGVRSLLRRQEVEQLNGRARIVGPGELSVRNSEGGTKVRFSDLIIATGSVEASMPNVSLDGECVVSSRRALEFKSVPDRMVVVGAGYIGLELGSVYARLGSSIVVVEIMDRVVPEMDREMAETAGKLLGEQGLDIRLGCRVTEVVRSNGGATVHYVSRDGEERIETDRVLVAVGRRPAIRKLGLGRIGLAPDKRGFIPVDAGMRTGVPHVYAIGDVVPTPMLAHVAMDEGAVAAERIAGRRSSMQYHAVPSVVYTAPELASVGLQEEEAAERGKIKVGRFPFRGNGRARARDDLEGWVKVIADADTDVILGVHCVGPDAGHLIHEAVVAMEYGGYAEDLALAIHSHPTLSEAFKEAALAVHGRALHI